MREQEMEEKEGEVGARDEEEGDEEGSCYVRGNEIGRGGRCGWRA